MPDLPWPIGACWWQWCSPSSAQASRGFDNGDPRGWLGRQTDWRARANAAQANSFEALPFFVGAVIIAQQLQAPQARVDILAFVWILLRSIYILMYVAGLPGVRSAVWVLAFAVNVLILLVGYR